MQLRSPSAQTRYAKKSFYRLFIQYEILVQFYLLYYIYLILGIKSSVLFHLNLLYMRNYNFDEIQTKHFGSIFISE